MTTRIAQFLAREGVHSNIFCYPRYPKIGLRACVIYHFYKLPKRAVATVVFTEYHDGDAYPIPRSPVDVLEDAVDDASRVNELAHIRASSNYTGEEYAAIDRLLEAAKETRPKLLQLMSEDELKWLAGEGEDTP